MSNVVNPVYNARMSTNNQTWIRPQAAARLLGCGITTIYRYADTGVLTRTLMDRRTYVLRSEIDRILAGKLARPPLGRPRLK